MDLAAMRKLVIVCIVAAVVNFLTILGATADVAGLYSLWASKPPVEIVFAVHHYSCAPMKVD
jgi:hypothetical protein